MKKLIPGVYSVIMTPFDNNGNIDKNSIKYSISRLVANEITGIVALGSNGEYPFLTLQEKKTVIDIVTDSVKDDVLLIAGIGTFGTDESIEIAKYAEIKGVNALLVALPIYYKLNFNDVYLHYKRIADAVSIPIIYYHFPETVHLDLSVNELSKIFNINKIIGIKESISNLNVVKQHIKALPKSTMFFSGSTFLMRPIMEQGGCGCICPVPNLIPDICMKFFNAISTGNIKKANTLENKIFELLPLFINSPLPTRILKNIYKISSEFGISLTMRGSSHSVLKESLRLLGYPINPIVKSPLPQLTNKEGKKVFKTLKKANLLKAELR